TRGSNAMSRRVCSPAFRRRTYLRLGRSSAGSISSVTAIRTSYCEAWQLSVTTCRPSNFFGGFGSAASLHHDHVAGKSALVSLWLRPAAYRRNDLRRRELGPIDVKGGPAEREIGPKGRKFGPMLDRKPSATPLIKPL